MAKQQKRQPENNTIPVAAYLPRSLVERIDEEARREVRARAQMIRRLIEEALTEREAVSAK